MEEKLPVQAFRRRRFFKWKCGFVPGDEKPRKMRKIFERFYFFVSKQKGKQKSVQPCAFCRVRLLFWRSGKKDLTNSLNFLFESSPVVGWGGNKAVEKSNC